MSTTHGLWFRAALIAALSQATKLTLSDTDKTVSELGSDVVKKEAETNLVQTDTSDDLSWLFLSSADTEPTSTYTSSSTSTFTMEPTSTFTMAPTTTYTMAPSTTNTFEDSLLTPKLSTTEPQTYTLSPQPEPTEWNYSPYYYAEPEPVNRTPDPEELKKPDSMIHQVPCTPQRGTCSPQCPSARWDKETQRIYFDWVEDIEGCPALFEPQGTVVIMFTWVQYLNIAKHMTELKKDVVLNILQTKPIDCALSMSKPVCSLFEWPTKDLLPNETYFIGAMYTSSHYEGTVNYSAPVISATPLFVPAGEIEGITPGEEIHCHLHDHLH